MNAVVESALDPRPRTLDAVEAELNYLVPDGERPVSYAFEPPPGIPWQSGTYAPQRVSIRNARPLAEDGKLSLDTNGFELKWHRSALTDFSDDDVIRRVYYAEAVEFLKASTGAEHVVVFDHTLRDGSRTARGADSIREPVRRVHNDQTFISGPRRVRDHLPPDEAERRLAGRFAIVNLWRPLARVESQPLALCDARTIAPDDLIPSDLVYRDKVGETFSVAFNPAHRWFYFPEIDSDEPVLLKIYDSRDDGTARLSAHTAFDDPNSVPGAPPRRSIELRSLLFF
jgi:hypothetical protein